MIEELVKFIVTSLVENKEDVLIEKVDDKDKVAIIKVTLNPSDIGRVIGKNGKVASAIRMIVKSASNRMGIKYIVKINEKEN